MARKKVVISDKELEPTVLYTIKKKKFGFLRLVFLFAIFIGVAYYLPEISKYVDDYKKGNADLTINGIINIFYKGNKGSQTNNQKDNDNTTDDTNNKYSYDSKTVITTDDFSISNISLKDNVLTFDVTNLNDDTLSLINKKYFLIAYDEEDNALVTIKLVEDVFAANEKKPYEYNVDSDAIFYFMFKEMSIDEYPSFELSDGSSSFICSKTGEMIAYYYTDGVLSSIRSVTRVNKTDEKYDDIYADYMLNMDNENKKEGVNAKISTDDNGCTYTVEIDPNKVDEATIKKDYYYSKSTLPKVIKYEMELKDYSCK